MHRAEIVVVGVVFETPSEVFEATVEATEEAIYNSLFKAETVTSNGRTTDALPIEDRAAAQETAGARPRRTVRLAVTSRNDPMASARRG